jgi:Flp pilus assembly protein TadG
MAAAKRVGSNLYQATDGVSTVEFGLVAALLCWLVLGVIDLGVGFWQEMQVENAARAGAEYAVSTNNATSSAIQTAVTSATGLSGISATPAPSRSCYCADASSGLTSASCGSRCAAGGTAQHYWVVSAQKSYSTIFFWPAIPNPVTLSATAYAQN